MEYDNTNKGVLFRNTDKQQETHADMSGSINIEGVEYFLDGWTNTAKNGPRAGQSYLSIRAKPKQQQRLTPPKSSMSADPLAPSDDIPF